MAEIRHLDNRRDVIFFCRGWSDLDKISETGAEWQDGFIHIAASGWISVNTEEKKNKHYIQKVKNQ